MTKKTIYQYGSYKVQVTRTGLGLRLVVADPDTVAEVVIPNTKIDSFIKTLTDTATAPDWTRAKFIRIVARVGDSYTMARTADNAWTSESGDVSSTESILDWDADIEIIA